MKEINEGVELRRHRLTASSEPFCRRRGGGQQSGQQSASASAPLCARGPGAEDEDLASLLGPSHRQGAGRVPRGARVRRRAAWAEHGRAFRISESCSRTVAWCVLFALKQPSTHEASKMFVFEKAPRQSISRKRAGQRHVQADSYQDD